MGLFWKQFCALSRKNRTALFQHPLVNLITCLILPVGYAVFIAMTPRFFNSRPSTGLGNAVPITPLKNAFNPKHPIVWADITNRTGFISSNDIMAHITQNFTSSQRNAVIQVEDVNAIFAACPPRKCLATLSFEHIPASLNDTVRSFNYTLRVDRGPRSLNIEHNTWVEKSILPLQLAIDQAIVDLSVHIKIPTPLEWPFTHPVKQSVQTNEDRIGLIDFMGMQFMIAYILVFIVIVYQLSGALAMERATSLASHMKAMGLLDSARILSWHISLSLTHLPAWIAISLIWTYCIFSETNAGLIFCIHVLTGLALAGWSLFVAVPFAKSPHLASIVSAALMIGLAALASNVNALMNARSSTAAILSLIFPPMNYIFSIRAVSGFEVEEHATNALKGDPHTRLLLLPLIFMALINVFLWPYLAMVLDRVLYDNRRPRTWWSIFRVSERHQDERAPFPSDTAISINNLTKLYSSFRFRRMRTETATAINSLSIDIPKSGIFVLLGPNGAGKSTTLSVLGGLTTPTMGSIMFEGGVSHPSRGTLGVVPQQNVLFAELSCLQTLQLWSVIKNSSNSSPDEDLEQLLHDCDLGGKIHSRADTLSGGQKRKLQLAIGLVGGSKIVLVDECTSGVDPISRRALWKTLTSYHNERTIVLTTHFLDEADLLADTIAVLGSNGALVAEGSPVALKATLGQGYSVKVDLSPLNDNPTAQESDFKRLLEQIKTIAPECSFGMSSSHQASYNLKTRDLCIVGAVLQLVESRKTFLGVSSYEIFGTTIEDIFLDLMDTELPEKKLDNAGPSQKDFNAVAPTSFEGLELTDGRIRSTFSQALTIFHKRALILRRSWLSPLLALVIAAFCAYFPLAILQGSRAPCTLVGDDGFSSLLESFSLYLPATLQTSYAPLFMLSPPNVTSVLNIPTTRMRSYPRYRPVPGVEPNPPNADGLIPENIFFNYPDNATFVKTIRENYDALLDAGVGLGGISVDLETSNILIVWEAAPPPYNLMSYLNLATNVVLNHAMNALDNTRIAPTLIQAHYLDLPRSNADDFFPLFWVAVFGVGMVVYSASFTLYVSRERRSFVQAMHMSNGLSNPTGLWLGHLLFDSMLSVITATVLTIIFAKASHQFMGLGVFWLIIVLYGIASTLFSYVFAIIMPSPRSAYAGVAFYQFLAVIFTLMAYVLTSALGDVDNKIRNLIIIQFTLSVIAPVSSLMRAAVISINLFIVNCEGNVLVNESGLVSITRYGGVILYLILYSLTLLLVIAWVDSRSLAKWGAPGVGEQKDSLYATDINPEKAQSDVLTEAKQVASSLDLLRILNVSKSYDGNTVVNDVSFGVSRNSIFAMLGPNGAGKTTTLDIIRGSVAPDSGDVIINGTSILRDRNTARLSLGVCPQFTIVDPQLTAKEHLLIYGRLKGLDRGEELHRNVDMLLKATGLDPYADRLAKQLSGGNQRRLSLAISLLGNPSVILIDEFSTGIDAAVKRDLWKLIKNVSHGKALVITTHSMEEATSLATKVGIMSKRMLAIGTPNELASRYPTYTVHFSCRTKEDLAKAQKLMAIIPDSRMAVDLSTRFEVPITPTGAKDTNDKYLSLADLFALLSRQTDFPEFTVEKSTLEAAFIKIIRENDGLDNLEEHVGRRWWGVLC